MIIISYVNYLLKKCKLNHSSAANGELYSQVVNAISAINNTFAGKSRHNKGQDHSKSLLGEQSEPHTGVFNRDFG